MRKRLQINPPTFAIRSRRDSGPDSAIDARAGTFARTYGPILISRQTTSIVAALRGPIPKFDMPAGADATSDANTSAAKNVWSVGRNAPVSIVAIPFTPL